MSVSLPFLCMLVGLALYLLPFSGWAARLNQLGLVTFFAGLLAWLGV